MTRANVTKLPRLAWRRHPVVLVAGLLLGACLARAAEPKVISLPPFLVEETAQRLPWRYTRVGEWEVLSSCPDRLTRALVANHHRLHTLLGELLPPALQLQMSAQTLLFVDSAHQPPSSREVMAAMALTAAEQDRLQDIVEPIVDDGRLRRRPPPPRYTFLPNLRLWDRDASVLFAIIQEREFDARRIALTPDYIAYILTNRIPALPPWFVSGVLTLAARARFTDDALLIERLDWLSEAGAAALKSGPEANRALLPLRDFFAGELAASDPAGGEALSLWQAQAALFVRWGLAGRGAPRREALWAFAGRAAVEPVTEALFQECFGFDFTEAQKQIAAYLPEALRTRLTLRPTQRLRPPDVTLRSATEGEIARIRGDWERLEIGYVKAHFPVLAPKYIEQARRTLMRGYERGERDARLLATIGLCEIEAGNDAAARPFFEDAAKQSENLRPRALYELARLRFAALRGGRASTSVRLTPKQADTMLAPLLTARERPPPLPEIYELLADVRAACVEAPTREQLAVIEEGVRLFPRNSELVFRAAELNVRHGFTDSARWLITLGLTLAPDAATRSRFEQLQAQVDAAKSKQ